MPSEAFMVLLALEAETLLNFESIVYRFTSRSVWVKTKMYRWFFFFFFKANCDPINIFLRKM